MVKINLTNDILKVLPLIKITKTEEPEFGSYAGSKISMNDFFWGGTVLENFMQAWGKYDEHVSGSEQSEEGRYWSEELENKAWNTFDYIVSNLADIISIIFSNLPNVKEGVYSRRTKSPGIWNYTPFENKSNN